MLSEAKHLTTDGANYDVHGSLSKRSCNRSSDSSIRKLGGAV